MYNKINIGFLHGSCLEKCWTEKELKTELVVKSLGDSRLRTFTLPGLNEVNQCRPLNNYKETKTGAKLGPNFPAHDGDTKI